MNLGRVGSVPVELSCISVGCSFGDAVEIPIQYRQSKFNMNHGKYPPAVVSQ